MPRGVKYRNDDTDAHVNNEWCVLTRKRVKMGWTMGLEPTTAGITSRSSTN